MDFEIESERLSDGLYVISLGGEIDLYTAPEFKQQLIEALQAGARMIVVDLTKTTFIDSTTLGVLVGAVKRLRESGGELSLVCRDQNITKVFEITGLDRVFSIHASREEALSATIPGGAPPS
jgi:anti-sigma B factor antagonist